MYYIRFWLLCMLPICIPLRIYSICHKIRTTCQGFQKNYEINHELLQWYIQVYKQTKWCTWLKNVKNRDSQMRSRVSIGCLFDVLREPRRVQKISGFGKAWNKSILYDRIPLNMQNFKCTLQNRRFLNPVYGTLY